MKTLVAKSPYIAFFLILPISLAIVAGFIHLTSTIAIATFIASIVTMLLSCVLMLDHSLIRLLPIFFASLFLASISSIHMPSPTNTPDQTPQTQAA